jgi:hypothetical protein
VLQIHPLKGIFLLAHQQFTVQYRFSRTHRPLYLLLYFNHQPWDPHVIDYPFIYPTLLSPPLPHLPPPPLPPFSLPHSPTYPRRPCQRRPCGGARRAWRGGRTRLRRGAEASGVRSGDSGGRAVESGADRRGEVGEAAMDLARLSPQAHWLLRPFLLFNSRGGRDGGARTTRGCGSCGDEWGEAGGHGLELGHGARRRQGAGRGRRRRWRAPLLHLDLLEPRAEVEELEDVAAARARRPRQRILPFLLLPAVARSNNSGHKVGPLQAVAHDWKRAGCGAHGLRTGGAVWPTVPRCRQKKRQIHTPPSVASRWRMLYSGDAASERDIP